MTLEQLLLALHVASAVLGLGQVGAVVSLTRYAQTKKGDGELLALLRKLFGTLSVSVAIVLVTGIAMDFASHGAWHATLFFRIGFVAAIAIGACAGVAGSKLKKADASSEQAALGSALTLGRVIALITLLSALLMVIKPG